MELCCMTCTNVSTTIYLLCVSESIVWVGYEMLGKWKSFKALKKKPEK